VRSPHSNAYSQTVIRIRQQLAQKIAYCVRSANHVSAFRRQHSETPTRVRGHPMPEAVLAAPDSDAAGRSAPGIRPARTPVLADYDVLGARRSKRFADDRTSHALASRPPRCCSSSPNKKRRATIAQVSTAPDTARRVRRSLHTLVNLGSWRSTTRPLLPAAARALLQPRLPVGVAAGVAAQPILDGWARTCASLLAGDPRRRRDHLPRASASSRIMSPSLNVGRRLPAFCTSIGRCCSHTCRRRSSDAYLARTRSCFHRVTVTSPRPARAPHRVNENGYA